jgi:16S rRNA (guanine966-N2)-methyltransferase
VRESLFNVLSARLDFADLTVLDLYAGSGALGLEALSRGAATAVFVESDARAAAVIAANIAELKFTGALVRRATVAVTLGLRAAHPADLVFADPPYDVANTDVEAMLGLLTGNGWAAENAVAVIERPAAAAALIWPPGWAAWPRRRYGDTRLEFAERAE